MPDGLRGRIVRQLPGVGWRAELLDRRAAQVERLRAQVEGLRGRVGTLEQEARDLRARAAEAEDAARQAREELGVVGSGPGGTLPPSFRRNLLNLRRNVEALRPHDPRADHPLLQIPRKLRNYRLAASHGVPVPDVLGVWRNLDHIDLSAMPEEFVLKSDGGAGGKGVFPLRRVDTETFRIIGGTDEVLTVQDLRQRYRDHPASRGPFFAERFLQQADGVEEIPDDIKIYAMYGEVAHVMFRRMPLHADLRSARYRYLGPDGQDLGEDVSPAQRIDSTIRAPERFPEFVRIGEHLSRAVGLPFIRVDVYDTVDGPVLGELTRAPGGPQQYRSDHDQHLGRLWDVAQYRLDLDVQAGRPLRILHGEHPAPNPYPVDPAARPDRPGPGGREIVTAPCREWCGTE